MPACGFPLCSGHNVWPDSPDWTTQRTPDTIYLLRGLLQVNLNLNELEELYKTRHYLMTMKT